ncbi:glycosyltransferase [Sphingomonas asaccharolytica]|uniref:glycosyltransferase n=1 Tax=Sphingomonas asaccharolytica TaxID=40681 RepID=UPI001472132F|nr:glycosyltransferase [Sphingomonas asaccharolytica]
MTLARLRLPSQMRPLQKRIDPYAAWRAANRLTPATRADLVAALANRSSELGRISVVMPVYRPALDLLAEAIGSVQAQIHERWQLCIADDGSNDPELAAMLADLTHDRRIVVTHAAKNRGIAAATNAAAMLASGDILVFLDQDDLLTPDALAEIALAFAEDPDCDLVYSDNDKIEIDGLLSAPAFKPAWSPVLLLSYMYLGHAMAVRRTLFKSLGGMRPAFDGSQDYDFALRASELARNIRHVAKVLYHWRVLPGSTAMGGGEKPQSFAAGEAAVQEALARRSIPATAGRPDWAHEKRIGLHALTFRSDPGTISIVTATRSGRPTDLDAIASLAGLCPAGAELLVIDSGAGPSPAIEAASIRAGLHLRWVACAANATLSARLDAAVREATGDTLIFVSPGSRPIGSDWSGQLAGYAGLDGVGAAGARLVDREGYIVEAGLVSPLRTASLTPAFAGRPGHATGYLYLGRVAHETSAISGHCFAVRRTYLLDSHAFNEVVEDWYSIGVACSEAMHRIGRSVVAVAGADAEVEAFSGRPIVGDAHDALYNRNLAGGERLFRPAPRRYPRVTGTPMRVVFFSHRLDHEGAPATLFDLVGGLCARGDIVATILSPQDGPLADAYRAKGIAVEQFEPLSRKAGAKKFTIHVTNLAARLKRLGADAVFANTTEMFPAVLAAREAGIGAVWWQHEGGGWNEVFKRYAPVQRAHARAAFAYAYVVAFVAEATRREFAPLFLRGNDAIVRYAIPPERIASDRQRWARADARRMLGIGDDEICILSLGSYCMRKAQRDLIRAAAGLDGALQAKVRILIVGAPVEANYARALAVARDALPSGLAARVVLTGAVDDTALYYAAADIFACTSLRESAPRVLMEAMWFGLPVVASRVDGVPELVAEGRSALLYPAGETATLASLLSTLAQDADLRHRLGRDGTAHVAQIADYDAMLSSWNEVIRECACLTSE